MVKKERIPILLFAMICLLAGIWSGLTRIGWNLTILPVTAHHGAIMVGGFIGTLIILEKIIPLRKKILYILPVVNALSLLLYFSSKPQMAIYILIFSSMGLSFIFLYYLLTQRSIVYMLMFLGSVCWVIGNFLLLTKSFYPMAFPWWTAFALFIITAERLELMKFLPVGKRSKLLFLMMISIFSVGVVFSFHGTGSLLCGASLVGIAFWLLKHDIVGLNLKKAGLSKFVAVALLCGYCALTLTGVFFFSLSEQWLSYDAIVHTFFLGFVFSMIFAHGPIILPGVLGIAINPFHKILYLWLALLQISWVVRVFGDVIVAMDVRRISGMVSAVTIIGYFITMAVLTIERQRNAQVR